MTPSMKYRDIEAALLANGCRWTPGKGSHVKWYCPCGQHIAVVNKHRVVSPGVVADVIKKMQCLEEGWLV